MPSDVFYPCNLEESLFHVVSVWWTVLFHFILRFTASNLGLHCFPMPNYKTLGIKSVKLRVAW